MVAKFATTKDKAARFRFRLKVAHGEIITDSEAYVVEGRGKERYRVGQKNADGAIGVDLT